MVVGAMAGSDPSQEEVLSWFERFSNWGRWGEDDSLGTLNLITPAHRTAAAALVTEGITVSCAWEIATTPSIDQRFGPPQRFMVSTGEGVVEGADGPRYAGAAEHIGLVYHGYSVSHLDGLSHYFWDGHMYGGRPAGLVTAGGGAGQLAVTDAATGIVGAGVLLDVAAERGVDWLEPGEGVRPADLEAAEARQGERVGEGDVVLLRTGYGARRHRHGPDDVAAVGRAGWHVSCIPWLRERGVAAIGCDTAQDVHPSGYEALRSPVHAVGIVAMGLWLIDNCDLEALHDTCERLSRWRFHLSVAPLRVVGGTGSPVNPLATF